MGQRHELVLCKYLTEWKTDPVHAGNVKYTKLRVKLQTVEAARWRVIAGLAKTSKTAGCVGGIYRRNIKCITHLTCLFQIIMKQDAYAAKIVLQPTKNTAKRQRKNKFVKKAARF